MTASQSPLVIIAGPTASGKSALALGLAEKFSGTVINADSMQLYRDLSIMTARPDALALARAPHALYGVADGATLSSVADWADQARGAADAARSAGRLPILCGGSGLYLRTMLEGIAPIPPIPQEIRDGVRRLHETLGPDAFHARLAEIDPQSAMRLPASDTQRTIRAYEVVAATGVCLGEWHRRAKPTFPDFTPITLLLDPPRADLHQAIDARFCAMMADGALDEVAALKARTLDPALPIMKAVGVPALIDYLDGKTTLEATIARGQAASRQYAKRQCTWFRHQLDPDHRWDKKYSYETLVCFCHIISKIA